jgi:hypothetical protein
LQYAHLREMTGEAKADAVEQGVIARVLGYLRNDHLAWINPAALVYQPVDGLYVSSWTTAKILYLLSETWARTGEPQARRQARDVLGALRKLAQWDGDRAWYMGIAPFRDGQWLLEGSCQWHGRNYPFIVEPLVRYWECTGDEQGLDLARAFAEGFLAGSQPDMGKQRIDPESGAFEHHVHAHTHAMWGVAHLGAVLHEPRYLAWVQKAYEFVRANGTDYGWYPEHIPQRRHKTEICVVGDMISIAAWLARSGQPHYWDHVEQTVRNELGKSQFSLTPEFLDLFHRLHRDKSTAVVSQAIDELKMLEGGFVAQSLFDDWVGYPSAEMGQPGMGRNGIHMMGCCSPEGMRGLHEAWLGTVEQAADGRVYVNMGFARDHPAALVRSYAPAAGRLDVQAYKSATFLLHPPAWVIRDQVVAMRNGEERAVRWGGPAEAYVLFERAQSGDQIGIRWPVPAFTQTVTPSSVPGHTDPLAIRWAGSSVESVAPPGRYLVMFRPQAG